MNQVDAIKKLISWVEDATPKLNAATDAMLIMAKAISDLQERLEKLEQPSNKSGDDNVE